MKNKRIPEVRFAGFDGEWEERKFTNIVSRVSRQSNDANLPKVEFEDIISGEGRLNKDISQKCDDRKGIAFESDFILFGKLRPYLKKWLFPNFKGIAIGDFWVFESRNAFSTFIYYLIQTDKYQLVSNLSSGTKMPRSDWKIVSETEFRVPSYQEQIKIGNFFKQLDDTISLHQQELTTLKQTKQGFLQKMFPKEGESVPEIRFAGFDGEWEERELNYFLEASNKRNYKNEFSINDVFSVSGEYGIVNQIDFQGRSFAGKSVENYWVVKKGYVVYTKSPLKANPYGIIKTNKGKPGIVSTLYAVYKPKGNLHPPIIEIMFGNNPVINNYLRPLVNKGAKNDMKVRNEDVLKGKIRLPSIEEQTKIGNFFKQLDDTIALHQRELDALKETKKAFLQKMFV